MVLERQRQSAKGYILMALGVLCILARIPSIAAPAPRHDFSIERQEIRSALIAFSDQTKASLVLPIDLGRTTEAVVSLYGSFATDQGLQRLLETTSLRARQIADNVYQIEPVEPPALQDRPAVPMAISTKTSPHTEEIWARLINHHVTLGDLPASVTAYGRDQIENMNLEQAKDYIPRIPNAVFSTSPVYGHGSLTVRGVSNVASEDEPSAFLIDGINISKSINDVLIHDVERIQVLRGPQGATHGSNTIGGVIEITTAAPQPTPFFELGIGYGRFKERHVDAIANFPITPKLFFRSSASVRRGGDIVHNVYAGPTIGPSRNKRSGTDFLRLQVRHIASDAFTVDIGLTHLRGYRAEREFVSTGTPAPYGSVHYGRAGLPVNPDKSPFYPETVDRIQHNFPNSSAVKVSMLRLGTQYRNGDLSINTITAYVHQKLSSFEDEDMTTLDLSSKETTSEINSFNQQVTAIHNSGWGGVWILGGALQHHDAEKLRAFGVGDDYPYSHLKVSLDGTAYDHLLADSIYQIQHRTAKETLTEIFLKNITMIGKRLSITSAIRYQHIRFKQVLVAGIYAPVTGDAILTNQTDPAGHSIILPALSVNFDASSFAHLYASISRGAKQGSIGGISTSSPFSTKPEKAWNYEAGVRFDFPEHRIRLDTTVFYMRLTDLRFRAEYTASIGPDEIPFTGLGDSNSAHATSKGIEIEFSYRPIDALTFDAALGYLEARYRNTVLPARPGLEYDFDGLRLANAPKWTASADIEYRFSVGNSWNGVLRLEWRARTAITFINEPNDFFVGAYPVRSPRYDVWNLRATLIKGDIRVTAFVENLLNERYYNAVGGEFSLVGYTVQPNPRRWGVELTYSFN